MHGLTMVTIDTTGARAVLDALESGGDETAIDDAIDVNSFQIDYYSTHLEEIGPDKFRGLLRDPKRECDHEVLDNLRQGFEQALEQSGHLHDQLAHLETLDTTSIERDVRRYLPSSVELDGKVYATIDGFNGGFQYRGDIGISVLDMEPTRYPQKFKHELHHAGVQRVIDDSIPYVRVMRSESAAGDCLRLLFTLLMEGLAIYYAQGGFEPYERTPAGADRIAEYRNQETQLFDEVQATLRDVLETEDPALRKELRREIILDEEGVLPPSHYIGTRMVATMDQYHDTSDIVACIETPERFLPLYQEAAQQQEGYAFDSNLITRITQLVD